MVADLHKNKFALIDRLDTKAVVSPSHDSEGDCATTLSLRFESVEECNAFSERCRENGLDITIPINTGKHVYTNWTQIMEKRGGVHPAMDPYKMKENENLQHNYTFDMCPKALDFLARTAYIGINPDWADSEIEKIAGIINKSL